MKNCIVPVRKGETLSFALQETSSCLFCRPRAFLKASTQGPCLTSMHYPDHETLERFRSPPSGFPANTADWLAGRCVRSCRYTIVPSMYAGQPPKPGYHNHPVCSTSHSHKKLFLSNTLRLTYSLMNLLELVQGVRSRRVQIGAGKSVDTIFSRSSLGIDLRNAFVQCCN